MQHGIERRSELGKTQFKVHRINGESAWQDSVDARNTVRDHADEWAFAPFSADDQRRAQKDMPLNPELVAR